MDCGVYVATGDMWGRKGGGGGGGGGGGFSHESEHDLAAMVSDFLENNGSSGDHSRHYSSDSDSGFCDLAHLAHNISQVWSLYITPREGWMLQLVASYSAGFVCCFWRLGARP